MTLSRRSFFKSCACAAGGAALMRPLAFGAPALRMLQSPTPSNRILVLLNLEGAYDALSMVPPRGASGAGSVLARYLQIRPTLGWNPTGPTPSLPMAGNSDWGWHPALSTWNTHFAAGDLAVVFKTGLPAPELSHFKSRDIMSRGRTDLTSNPDRRGWLGRLADGPLPNSLDIVGVGVGNRPDFNATAGRPLRIQSVADFSKGTFSGVTDNALRNDILSQMMAQAFANEARINAALRPTVNDGQVLSTAIQTALAGITLPNAAAYPPRTTERLGGTLADIARLIAASLGTRVFYTTTGGFDTHGGQEITGTGAKPTLTARLQLVDQALQAFIADLKSPQINKWDDVAILVYSEFGRRNFENQTLGTDHGFGFHSFVLGGGVAGGLKGTPVTLGNLNASSGYLPADIDFRTVFKKSLQDWLQLPPATVNSVFDDFVVNPGEPAFTLFT